MIFIALTYIVSRYLYIVALIVPSKIDILFNPIEKVIYRLINTKLEHMSGKTYLKHFLVQRNNRDSGIDIIIDATMALVKPESQFKPIHIFWPLIQWLHL